MLLLLAMVSLMGCGPSTAVPVPRLVAAPDLRIEDAVLGTSQRVSFVVHNTGTADGWVLAEVDAPFRLPSVGVWVPAASDASLGVVYRPEGYEPASGALVLTLVLVAEELQQFTVAVSGTTEPDADDDGYEALGAGGDDCDDGDAGVHPGAEELCNHLDDDCDGASDEEAADTRLWYPDADGDGWGAGYDAVVACFAPDGYVANTGDCLDSDPRVHPGAEEEWYDGVDSNCDGANDYDQDRDGHVADDWGGDDCDDTRADTHPGAEEVWYDGLDQDCDEASDWDQDGDGFESDAYGGEDCDDLDAGRAPPIPEVDDGVDQDCDGRVDEDFVLVDDLVITEILVDPEAVDDEDGQFVEIANLSARDVVLDGLGVYTTSGGTNALESGELLAGEVGLLCANTAPADNGGLSCLGPLPAPFDAADSVGIGLEGLLDRVDWTGWSAAAGTSWELAPGSLDATSNDDPASWCEASSTSVTGDLGSPGDLDGHCP